MTIFSGAKINIGLRVLGKRNDGYHNISTLFYPLPFPISDVVEIVQSKDLKFTHSGLPLDIDFKDNLCMKAFFAVKEKYKEIPPVHIYLHKVVPLGSGLGGGSANATCVVKMLDSMFNLQMSLQQQIAMVKKLGSDCPFFLFNKPCLAEGVGEKITPFERFSLKGLFLVLVFPSFPISTAQIFSSFMAINYNPQPFVLEDFQEVNKWTKLAKNDLETVAFQIHPKLKSIKKHLLADGAFYASMTGSGSTMFGIFDKEPKLTDWAKEYNIKTLRLEH